jgi:hypothetical protein
MPIAVTCTACGKVKNVPDEIAGRRIKCTGCGGIVSLPAPSSTTPESAPLEAAITEPPADLDFSTPKDKKPSKKKSKKKPASTSSARLLLLVGLPALCLLVLGGCLTGGILWWSSGGEPKDPAKVRRVDVHSVFQGKSVGHDNMLVLTRTHPEGSHLFVDFRLPVDLQKKRHAEEGGGYSIQLGWRDLALKVPGEDVPRKPLFLVNVGDRSGMQLSFSEKFSMPYGEWLDENVPPRDSPWTHEGEMKLEDNFFEFQGKGGMRAKVSYPRPTITELTVTWDDQSQAWSGNPDGYSLPIDFIVRPQQIQCVYPMPKTKDGLILQVLGREYPITVE